MAGSGKRWLGDVFRCGLLGWQVFQLVRYGLTRRLIALTLALTVVGCANRAQPVRLVELPDIPAPVESRRLSGAINEVAPPAIFLDLKDLMTGVEPQVAIASPKPETTLSGPDVAVQLKLRNLSIYKDKKLGLGPHLQLILDNQPAQSIYTLDEPVELKNLAPGSHTLRVFAVWPWGESFKNEAAYAQTTFHVLAETGEHTPDPAKPLLTFSQPQGTYAAQPVLLDYYLTNAPLHQLAQADDTLTDWKIRCTVNGQSFVTDQWQPFYLKGLKPGQNWVQLALIDDQGKPIENAFNSTVRIVNYDPKKKDTLAKLVRGELSIRDVGQIVDPTYEPPPEPIEEPEVIEELPPPSEEIAPETTRSEEAETSSGESSATNTDKILPTRPEEDLPIENDQENDAIQESETTPNDSQNRELPEASLLEESEPPVPQKGFPDSLSEPSVEDELPAVPDVENSEEAAAEATPSLKGGLNKTETESLDEVDNLPAQDDSVDQVPAADEPPEKVAPADVPDRSFFGGFKAFFKSKAGNDTALPSAVPAPSAVEEPSLDETDERSLQPVEPEDNASPETSEPLVPEPLVPEPLVPEPLVPEPSSADNTTPLNDVDSPADYDNAANYDDATDYDDAADYERETNLEDAPTSSDLDTDEMQDKLLVEPSEPSASPSQNIFDSLKSFFKPGQEAESSVSMPSSERSKGEAAQEEIADEDDSSLSESAPEDDVFSDLDSTEDIPIPLRDLPVNAPAPEIVPTLPPSPSATSAEPEVSEPSGPTFDESTDFDESVNSEADSASTSSSIWAQIKGLKDRAFPATDDSVPPEPEASTPVPEEGGVDATDDTDVERLEDDIDAEKLDDDAEKLDTQPFEDIPAVQDIPDSLSAPESAAQTLLIPKPE